MALIRRRHAAEARRRAARLPRAALASPGVEAWQAGVLTADAGVAKGQHGRGPEDGSTCTGGPATTAPQPTNRLRRFWDQHAASIEAYCLTLCPPNVVPGAVHGALERFLATTDEDATEDMLLHQLQVATRTAAAARAQVVAPPQRRLARILSTSRASNACLQAPRILAARANGQLSGDDRRRLDEHLKRCHRCRAAAARFGAADGAFARSEQAAPGGGLSATHAAPAWMADVPVTLEPGITEPVPPVTSGDWPRSAAPSPSDPVGSTLSPAEPPELTTSEIAQQPDDPDELDEEPDRGTYTGGGRRLGTPTARRRLRLPVILLVLIVVALVAAAAFAVTHAVDRKTHRTPIRPASSVAPATRPRRSGASIDHSGRHRTRHRRRREASNATTTTRARSGSSPAAPPDASGPAPSSSAPVAHSPAPAAAPPNRAAPGPRSPSTGANTQTPSDTTTAPASTSDTTTTTTAPPPTTTSPPSTSTSTSTTPVSPSG